MTKIINKKTAYVESIIDDIHLETNHYLTNYVSNAYREKHEMEIGEIGFSENDNDNNY